MKKTKKTINVKIDRHFTLTASGYPMDIKSYFDMTTDNKNFDKDYNQGIKNVKLTYEIDEPILDETEKRYLSAVIKPFRNEIKYIAKHGRYYSDYYIDIAMKNDDSLIFPYFKDKRMYKGMESEKEYTLEELGL